MENKQSCDAAPSPATQEARQDANENANEIHYQNLINDRCAAPSKITEIVAELGVVLKTNQAPRSKNLPWCNRWSQDAAQHQPAPARSRDAAATYEQSTRRRFELHRAAGRSFQASWCGDLDRDHSS